MESLPPERVEGLRQLIHEQVARSDIHDRIRAVLNDMLVSGADMSEPHIQEVLRQRGLVGDVLKALGYSDPPATGSLAAAAAIGRGGAGGGGASASGAQGLGGGAHAGHHSGGAAAAAQSGLSGLSLQHIHGHKRYIYVSFHGGKAFLDSSSLSASVHGNGSAGGRGGGGDGEDEHDGSSLSLHLSFCGQRFRGQKVANTTDPAFAEGFLFELPDRVTVSLSSVLPDPFLACSEPVHIAILRHSPNGDTELIGCHALDWRHLVLRHLEGAALAAPATSGAPTTTTTTTSTSTSATHTAAAAAASPAMAAAAAAYSFQAIEVNGVGSGFSLPAGVLNIRVDVLPPPVPGLDLGVARAQLALERARVVDNERIFLVYAKQWWREYLELRPSHQQRLVKIFAADEHGVPRPASSAVRELDPGRHLDTPRQAARFVSLLGLERMAAVGDTGGGGRVDQWSHTHSLLVRGKGDVEDHAVLLCSLLLGFGLNAMVCLGTKHAPADRGGTVSIAHAWVATMGVDGEVTFWESLTAERFSYRSDHPFRTLDCLFNHRCFFANLQPSSSLSECSLDLTNDSYWKAMSADSLTLLQRPWPCTPLLPNPIDAMTAAFELEKELRGYANELRAEVGLTTTWDAGLGRMLTQALAAYELQRAAGVAVGNEEFQQAIKHSIPPGHTFKGFPMQFTHVNGLRIFAALRAAQPCHDILSARGHQVAHAVRVRIFPYAESAHAVWVMLAVKYRAAL